MDIIVGLVIAVALICFVAGFFVGEASVKGDIRDLLRVLDKHNESDRISIKALRSLLRALLD